MDLEIYEAAKTVLEAELATTTDEREKARLEVALADIKARYEASVNG